jgi:hypothetical protein
VSKLPESACLPSGEIASACGGLNDRSLVFRQVAAPSASLPSSLRQPGVPGTSVSAPVAASRENAPTSWAPFPAT